MKKYINIPQYTTLNEIIQRNFTLSATQYKRFCIKNSNIKTIKDFLEHPLFRSDFGIEVGSDCYVDFSNYVFIKTKALQEDSYLLSENKEATEYIKPQAFINMHLKKGDIIISKDSNVGEIIVLDKDYPNSMLCSGLCRLPIKKNGLYLLAFIKSALFRQQIDFIVPRGSTIKHGKTKFLECKIPFPNIKIDETIQYIELLMQAIINKEIAIRKKHEEIIQLIQNELELNQNSQEFIYTQPQISEIMAIDRMDTSLYSYEFKHKEYLITNYKYGYTSLTDLGYMGIRGTSLERNYIKNRINSDVYIDGFYKLIIPTNITKYGTVSKILYIGTPVKLKTIQKGDIVFGGEGYGKGKSFVVLENEPNVATNYHGIRIVCKKNTSIQNKIFIRCMLAFLRENGLIDKYGVGGNGGHFAPTYFYLAKIPNFPVEKIEKISYLYYNGFMSYSTKKCTISNFLEYDSKYNQVAGIHEIDVSMKYLQMKLDAAMTKIADDIEVSLTF